MTKSEKKDERLETEGKYKALVETAADAIFTLDLLGRFTFVNPAAERISGYSEEELVGKHFRDLLPANYIPTCLSAFQKAIRGQPSPPFEIEMITKEGERVTLELLGTPVKRGRRVVEIIGIAREITERKRAEEALALERNLLRALMDNVPDYIYFKDRESRFIRTTKAHTKAFGLSDPTEAIGKTDFDFFSDEHAQQAYADEQNIIKTGKPLVGIEEKETWPDGRETWVSTTKMPLRNEEGQIIGTFGISRDIAERKKAEEALRESENKYRNLVERANDGIIIIQDTIIRYANPRLAEMWGGTVQEFIGTPFTDHVHPDELPKLIDRYKRRMAGEDVTPIYETVLRRKDGSKLYAELNAGIITYQGKSADLVIVRDIAERKQAEEALRESEEIFKQFMENSPNYVFFKNDKIQAIRLSSNYEKMLGKPMHELLGKTMDDLFPSDLAKSMIADDLRVLNEGKQITVEEELNGRFYTTIKFPILIKGKPRYLAGYTIDITERKRAEETLRESEEKYRTILENIEDGYFEVDIAGNLTFFNDSLCRINGYSREEMMGMNNRQYMDDETAKAVYQTFNAVYRTGKPAKIFGYGIIQKDGTRRSVETSVSLISGSRGEPAGFRGIVRDITERKRAEEALRDEKALMDALMDNIPDSIYFKDRQCRLTRINRKMMRDLSLEEMSQALGKTDVDLFGEEFGRKTLVDDQRIMTTGEPIIGLIEGRQLGDGQINWTLTTKVPLRDASDQITGLVGITREINEIKQAEEEVQKRLREITALHKVSEVINATLDLKEVFQRVVEELSNAFGYRLVDIYLLEGESLRLQASVGYDAQTTIELIPLERGVLGRVARTGQPSFIRDVSQDPDYIGSHPDITREICIPVMSGGTTLGTLNVESDDKRPLTDHDLQLLSILSSHIGVAIENARLYDKTQRHLKTMTTLQKIGVEITSSLDLSTLLQGIADSTLKLTNADYLHLFVLDPETGEFTQRAASWQPEAKKPPITWPRKNKGLTAAVFKAKEPVVIERAADHPLYSTPEARKWGVQSVAGFPLKGKWGLTGVLNVVFLQPHTFSKDELQLLALLADQAAIAIENARLYEKTQQLAITDGLTGLYNLRYFYETLEKEIQRSERYHRSISLVILDIDDLKAYNDLYGHLAGDDLLKELARLMSKVTRRADTSARYGGDEFAIILPETETEGARVLAQRLLEEVKEHRFSTQNGQTIGRITTSLGIATYPHHADSAKALVDAADKALLRAKGAGKNQLFVCAEELTEVEPR